MQRFFFHIIRGGLRTLDSSGIDFPDLDTAVERAHIAVRDLLKDAVRDRQVLNDDIAIEIADRTSALVRLVIWASESGFSRDRATLH
jgi:hypothetical protein